MFSKIYLAYINNNKKKVPHAVCLLQAMSWYFYIAALRISYSKRLIRHLPMLELTGIKICC